MEEQSLARRQMMRKVDIRLQPLFWIMFFLCSLDRVNVGHARLYNLEKDLGINSELYGWNLTVFFIGYVILEIPSNIFLEKVGANIWFSKIMISWGLVTLTTAFSTNGVGFIILRFLLGMAEAGLFPGILLMLSLWYSKEEQAIRMAIFTTGAITGVIISGPLAALISQVKNWLGIASWQWIFIIESIPTILIGISLFWLIPKSPLDCKWLTTIEKSTLQKQWKEHQGKYEFSLTFILNSLKACFSFQIFIYAIIQFTYLTPKYSQIFLLPTVVRDLGFNPQHASLLTSPPNIFAMLVSLIAAWSSDRYLERSLHITISCLVSLLGHLLLIIIPSSYTLLRYSSLFLVKGGSACIHSSFFAWVSNNSQGTANIAIIMAFLSTIGNIDGMFSGQFFRKSEAPDYYISHSLCATSYLISMICVLILRFHLQLQNRYHNTHYIL